MAETRIIQTRMGAPETWKEIEGFGGYQISNTGIVRSDKFGKAIVRKITVDKKGYARVCLCNKGVQYTKKVHRLVAAAFISNPLNLPEVNHKDGIKINNCSDNLEWVNRKMNMGHAVVCNLLAKGSRNKSSKLKYNDIPVIKDLVIRQSISQRAVAKMYNVSYPTINAIICGRKWKSAI